MADRRPAAADPFAEGGGLRIKICCIASTHEADIATAAGADLLGLVSAMPSGPGPIEESRIAEIVQHVNGHPPAHVGHQASDHIGTRLATVLLTSRQDARSIGAQLDRMRPAVVQLVDEVAPAELALLRATHPDVALMQVIHVRDAAAVDEAVRVAPMVDAILLDSGNPGAAVKELGGTGRVHDWRVSRALREAVAVPVLLAGGLNAANVAEAIAVVRPFGVDVCSGVRTGGRLDGEKLREFIRAARSVRATT